MATLPFPDPRVEDLVRRQAEDRSEFRQSLGEMRLEMREGFKQVQAGLDARRWSPSTVSLVLGPFSAAVVAGIVVLVTGSHPGP